MPAYLEKARSGEGVRIATTELPRQQRTPSLIGAWAEGRRLDATVRLLHLI
jgi:hypothetical protein